MAGLHPESLERRALYQLEKYLYKKEWIDKALTMNGNDLVRYVNREPEPLSLPQVIERVGKPVFEKDAAGRKAWRVVKSLRIEHDGFWIAFTDGTEFFLNWKDDLKYLFAYEVD